MPNSKTIILLAGFLSLCIFMAFPAFAEEDQIAVFTEVKGSVSVKGEGEKIWEAAKEEDPLFEGDQIKTGKDGSAKIIFENESIIQIEKNSVLEIQEMVKGKKEESLVAKVKLSVGKIVNFVLHTDKFEVVTPTSIMGVRGTEFAVEARADETDVGVFSGEVGVRGVTDAGETTEEEVLGEEEETSVPRNKKPFPKKKLKKFLAMKKLMAKYRENNKKHRGKMQTFRNKIQQLKNLKQKHNLKKLKDLRRRKELWQKVKQHKEQNQQHKGKLEKIKEKIKEKRPQRPHRR